MDAWETLQSHSSSVGDAWDKLNSITGSSNVPGRIIDELRFTLKPLLQLSGSVSSSKLVGSVDALKMSGGTQVKSISGSAKTINPTGNISIQEI